MGNQLKANYLVREKTAERIILQDLGPWDQYATITNAAENVIAEVERLYGIGTRQVFYYDSEGELTELLVKDGRFVGFAQGVMEVKSGTTTSR